MKMAGLAAPALAAVDSGETTILPERFERTYRGWLENIRDWCASRHSCPPHHKALLRV